MSLSLRWRGIVATFVIFTLGLIAGSALTSFIGARQIRRAVQPPPPGTPTLAERAAKRISTDLTKELKLTPEEAQRIDAELGRMTAEMKRARVEMTREINRELRETIRRIAGTLPPEKRVEFMRLVKKRLNRAGLPPPPENEDRKQEP